MVPSLNDNHLANGHMSAISSNTPLLPMPWPIDIGYFCIMKKTSWVSPSFDASISGLGQFSKHLMPWNRSFSTANAAGLNAVHIHVVIQVNY